MARGHFLLDYIELLQRGECDDPAGFRHNAPRRGNGRRQLRPPRSRERWVVNKLRALGSWYTKGLRGGSQLRTRINSVESVDELREAIVGFFF